MQAIIASYNKNDKSNKFSVNNGNFSDNYFDNGDVGITNANNTKILYIFSAFSNNGLSNFCIMNQRNKVTYIADVTYKARFASLANIFISQLCNFLSLKIDRFHVIQSIIYKPELRKIRTFFQKDNKIHLYIVKYTRNLVNQKILYIKKFKLF